MIDSLPVIYVGIITVVLLVIYFVFLVPPEHEPATNKKSDAYQKDEIMYHPSRCWGEGPAWDCCGKVGEKAEGCTVVGEDMIMFHHPRYWNSDTNCYECCGNSSKLSQGCREGFHPKPYGLEPRCKILHVCICLCGSPLLAAVTLPRCVEQSLAVGHCRTKPCGVMKLLVLA